MPGRDLALAGKGSASERDPCLHPRNEGLTMTHRPDLTADPAAPEHLVIHAYLTHGFGRNREVSQDVDLAELSPAARASALYFHRDYAVPGTDDIELWHWHYDPLDREDKVSGWTVDTLDLRTIDRALIQMRAEKRQTDQDAQEAILVSALQSDSIWVEGRIGTGVIARELAPNVRASAEELIALQGGRRELDLVERYFNELDGQGLERPLGVAQLDRPSIEAGILRMAESTRHAFAEEAAYRQEVADQDPSGRAWTVAIYQSDGHTQDRFTIGHSSLAPATQEAALYLSQHTPMPSGALQLARYETADLQVFARDGGRLERELVVADLLVPNPRASDIDLFLPEAAATHHQAMAALREQPQALDYSDARRREHAAVRRRLVGQGLG